VPSPDLSTNLAGVLLRNPVILAGGTAGYLDEMSDVLDLAKVGAIITKSITPLPREGNPTHRILPAEVGMLNAIGLANIGVDPFIRDIVPRINSAPTRVIASVAGFTIDDYVRVAAAFDDCEAIQAVELNVSCPNVHGGCEFGADPALLRDLVGAVRSVLTHTRLVIKLSPVAVAVSGVGIVQLAQAAIEGLGKPAGPTSRPGADVISLANTTPAMAINPVTRRPLLANTTGGLSGPAVRPIAIKLVHDAYRGVCRSTQTPIIGTGGVSRWEHAAEFILAGATAVAMGTALFADPRSPAKVALGLERWARAQAVDSIATLIGAVAL
jgi:dihydroorotate dehydrogenase (NAD+) catalytic subunit